MAKRVIKKEEEVKPVEVNLGGAPSKHKPEYDEQVYMLCLLGATDKEIAKFFGVAKSTINLWKKEHEGFSDSIRAGKTQADMNIAQSLYKTGQDRTVIEQVPFKCKEVSYNRAGKRVEKEVVKIIEVEKTIPADFRSMQFWLKNRRPKNFRDKQEIEYNDKRPNVLNLGDGLDPDEGEEEPNL